MIQMPEEGVNAQNPEISLKNEGNSPNTDGVDEQMAKVLITTTYSYDSITLALTKFSIERVYLLIDRKPDETQQKSIDLIKKSFGRVLEIKERKIELYDVVAIAHSIIDLFDAISNKDEIIVNLTPSKKTQAIGLLLGSYKRSDRVSKIIYMPEETKDFIILPKLSFSLTESQQKILESIESSEQLTKLAEELGMSRAMLYRNIKELKNMGLIEENDGLKMTDAGKIAGM